MSLAQVLPPGSLAGKGTAADAAAELAPRIDVHLPHVSTGILRIRKDFSANVALAAPLGDGRVQIQSYMDK